MKVRLILILCLLAMPVAAASSDVSRLQAILIDTQNPKVTISADAWKVTANEANALAKRAGSGKAATELRKHVSEMRDAALKGDADGARTHAGLALPYANQLAR